MACSNASAKMGDVSADSVQITLDETGLAFSGFMDTPVTTLAKRANQVLARVLLVLVLVKPDLAWLLSSCTVPYYLVTILTPLPPYLAHSFLATG